MVKLEKLRPVKHTDIKVFQVPLNKNGLPFGPGCSISFKGYQYVGTFKNGLPHGEGILDMKEHGTYSGSFRKGYGHGRGVLSHPSGTFESLWSTGFIQRQKTTVIFKNGDRYDGDWDHYFPKGNGTFTYTDGVIFDGYFSWSGNLVKNSYSKGEIRYLKQNMIKKRIIDGYNYMEIYYFNEIILKASLEKGKMKSGTMVFLRESDKVREIPMNIKNDTENRSHFITNLKGKFRVPKKSDDAPESFIDCDIGENAEGTAIITKNNGYVYEGGIKKLQPHGSGKFIVGAEEFEGEFLDGKPINFKGKAEFKYRYYEGEWIDGVGQAKKHMKREGTVYEGGVKDLKPDGPITIYKDGVKEFEGVFKKGKLLSGEGIYYRKDLKFIGTFKENEEGVGKGEGIVLNEEKEFVFRGKVSHILEADFKNGITCYDDGLVYEYGKVPSIPEFKRQFKNPAMNEKKVINLLGTRYCSQNNSNFGYFRAPFSDNDMQYYEYHENVDYIEGEFLNWTGAKIQGLRINDPVEGDQSVNKCSMKLEFLDMKLRAKLTLDRFNLIKHNDP